MLDSNTNLVYHTYISIADSKEETDIAKNSRQEYNNGWNKDHYKTYAVKIRKDRKEGQELIDFIEDLRKQGLSISQVFTKGIQKLKDEGGL